MSKKQKTPEEEIEKSLSPAEAINALYSFRELGRRWFDEPNDENRLEFLKWLPDVIAVLPNDDERKELVNALMQGVFADLKKGDMPAIEVIEAKLDDKQSVFSFATAEARKELIAAIKEVHQQEKALKGTEKEVQGEEKAYVTEIRREIEETIKNKKKCDNKEELLQALSETQKINLKFGKGIHDVICQFEGANGKKFEMNIKLAIVLNNDFCEINGVKIGSRSGCQYCCFGKVSQDSMDFLRKTFKKSMSLTTAAGDLAKKLEDQNKTKKKVEGKKGDKGLLEKACDALKNKYICFLSSFDARKTLRRLFDEPEELCALMGVDKSKLADFYAGMLPQVLQSQKIWGAYHHLQYDTGRRDRDGRPIKISLYDKCAEDALYDKCTEDALELRTDYKQSFDNLARDFCQALEGIRTGSANEQQRDMLLRTELIKLKAKVLEVSSASIPYQVKADRFLPVLFDYLSGKKGNSYLHTDCITVMNRALSVLEGVREPKMRFRVHPMRVHYKMAGVKGTSGYVDGIMKDMAVKKEPWHRMEALLYRLGELLKTKQDVKLTFDIKDNPMLKNPAVWKIYRQFGGLFDGNMSKWNEFVSDAHNIHQAQKMYQALYLPEKYFGNRSEEYVQWLSREHGTGDVSEVPQTVNSVHHVVARKYAGFVTHGLEEAKGMFNHSDNLVDTVNLHPLFMDQHKDVEHRFDTEGKFIFSRGKQLLCGEFSDIAVGDTVYMPITQVRGADGTFHDLMTTGMLVMTPTGDVAMPHWDKRLWQDKEKSLWDGKALNVGHGCHGEDSSRE